MPFAPGTLAAQGYDAPGAAVAGATKTFVSAGAPHAIELTADRPKMSADRNDLTYVTATVVDSKGTRVPWSTAVISFAVDGADLELIAVGSGDPNDRSATLGVSSRTAYRGRAVAILRPVRGAPASFTAHVSATAGGGLASNSLAIVAA